MEKEAEKKKAEMVKQAELQKEAVIKKNADLLEIKKPAIENENETTKQVKTLEQTEVVNHPKLEKAGLSETKMQTKQTVTNPILKLFKYADVFRTKTNSDDVTKEIEVPMEVSNQGQIMDQEEMTTSSKLFKNKKQIGWIIIEKQPQAERERQKLEQALKKAKLLEEEQKRLQVLKDFQVEINERAAMQKNIRKQDQPPNPYKVMTIDHHNVHSYTSDETVSL